MTYKKFMKCAGLYCLLLGTNFLGAAAISTVDQMHKVWIKLYANELAFARNNGWIDLAQAIPYDPSVRQALRKSLHSYLQFPLLGPIRPSPCGIYGVPAPRPLFRSRL